MRIDPVATLESIGIDTYEIDYESNSVYLPTREYMRVLKYFQGSPLSCEIEAGGWRWCKDENYDSRQAGTERPAQVGI